MDTHMFTKLFFSLINTILLTALVQKALSAHQKFEACVPRNCGNGTSIRYPFWLSNEQESYCGFPNLEITCVEKEPVLKISDDDYSIRDIFYSNSSVLLAEARAFSDDCPIPRHNFSLASTPFHYSRSHTDLHFFYNCTAVPLNYLTYPITCAATSNKTLESFASLTHEGLLKFLNLMLETCQSYVIVPVDVGEDDSTESILQRDYKKFLKTGFLLEWDASSCSECEGSGGRCGFDNNQFRCFCSEGAHSKSCKDGKRKNVTMTLLICFLAGGIAFVGSIVLICCLIRKASSEKLVIPGKKEMKNGAVEAFLRNYGSLAPKRYKYSAVKKMTNSFKDKLGQGGYGCVYKGKLMDGRLVAVKLLSETKGNGEEFINEVSSIIRTSHVNIVTLLGFCFEGSKIALIYEFMPNGSLEKIIYDDEPTKNRRLGWETLHQIAVGIARGLEYLHRGCSTRILHFDIKPHNILLDEDFCPKISDFGLAKLCTRKESTVSMFGTRGTAGYIAPEVFSRNFGGVSHKSDVYSYGMMVLEMVGGRKNVDEGVDKTSEIYFPHWIYKNIQHSVHLGLHGISTEEEDKIARKMISVGLWCIQPKSSDRPSMSKVLEMFEGSLESIQIPPKPFLYSPSRSLTGSPTRSIL